MTYSCSDFTDAIPNRLVSHSALNQADIEPDDPEQQASLAIEAIDKLADSARRSPATAASPTAPVTGA